MKPSQSTKIDIQRCAQQAGNKFDLVLMAAYRARELSRGKPPLIDLPVKNTVIALAEIQQGLVTREVLRRVGRR